MIELKKYLMENYSKPLSEISKTENNNMLVQQDLEMISWDDVAKDFEEKNNEYDGRFATADGLYILEKEENMQLFFFEFRNIDYSNKEDYEMSKFHLKTSIDKMKKCEYDCRIYGEIEKISEYLVDKSHRSLRSKPSDSLSLFYNVMNDFYEDKNDKDCMDKVFKTEKFFFLVSNTESQYFKNKSNRHNRIIKPLNFLKRFEPYHYDMVFAVNESGFEKYFYQRNKDYFN